MRTVYPLNSGWTCAVGAGAPAPVTLPHCYNVQDGAVQLPLYRGTATYRRTLTLDAAPAGPVYLEIGAAALRGRVLVNGAVAGESDCGFALWRVLLTPHLRAGDNELVVEVSNAADVPLYPAMADFSFYGGLYRDVNLVFDDALHFAECDGSRDGVTVRCEENGDGSFTVYCDLHIEGCDDAALARAELRDADGELVAYGQDITAEYMEFMLRVAEPHRWQGTEDPYLYELTCCLYPAGAPACDVRRLAVGLRTVECTADGGLRLNGRPWQLHGVARHQDRMGKGSAVTRADMEQDLRLILELGANAVRLSHYQHAEEFYDLCDRAGLLVWAEVPVISAVDPAAEGNAMRQLDALIAQVGNHCCVYCWGVQNEFTITGTGPEHPALLTRLAARARELDPTRYVAQAQVYSLEDTSVLNTATDLVGYNLYYGWYYSAIPDLQARLDALHRALPGTPLLITEYGVDTNPRYHSPAPQAKDYSEEYQLLFCDNALRAVAERPWMVGSYVWAMFDFGSAQRDEGGQKGVNQKGLVTFDRAVKKDAFYLYKAWWSDEPFVRLAGRRFVNRCGETADITVLSNLAALRLSVNGVPAGEANAPDPMQVFAGVALAPGENRIEVTGRDAAGALYRDAMTLCRVAAPDPAYRAPQSGGGHAVNWFERAPADEGGPLPAPVENGFTFQDKLPAIWANTAARAVFLRYLAPLTENPRWDPAAPMTLEALLRLSHANVPQPVLDALAARLAAIPKP